MRHPLNLPPGSVRAALALMLVAALCVPTAMGRTVPPEVAALAGAVLSYYFRARESESPATVRKEAAHAD